MGNEYKGKTKLGIIAALCVVFSLWLMIKSGVVLTMLIMFASAILLFVGIRLFRYVFVVLQITRGGFAVVTLRSWSGLGLDSKAYYILYFLYAVASIMMLIADKDIREFYKRS